MGVSLVGVRAVVRAAAHSRGTLRLHYNWQLF
eukprot:COSAG06_NODE_42571_length_380_cov_1.074733_1_plen_31_part_10